MADKGFQIQDLLATLGVRLNIPPFLDSNQQMPHFNQKSCTLKDTSQRVPYFTEHVTCYYVEYRKSSHLCLLYADQLQCIIPIN